jgi:hypothetical protein
MDPRFRSLLQILQTSEHLTPEQRTRFFQFIKARIETSTQACPPWIRSFEQGQIRDGNTE